MQIFLTHLTQPIKQDLVAILKRLSTQDLGTYAHFETCIDPLKFPILPIDMYLDVEKQRQFSEPPSADLLRKAYASNNSAFS